VSWDNPSPINGATTPCGAGIHGHIRISPDGTMYVPNARCSGHQGMAITTNNLYFGYQDGTNNAHPKIAISHDGGATWGPSTDVGTSFGIQNTVFSEVIAGDPGRAAFAFVGTSTPGNYQEQTFKGVWYLYVAFTYDGGNRWQVVNASQNPLQRGCVDTSGVTGAYPGCRNMLDFNDITVDKQGRVHVAYTDGCTDSTNVPDANRMAGIPPAVVPAYNCRTNTAVNDTNCATSPQTFSEGASEYSYPTCTYGRQQAVLRQVCGQGLFAANDPGFTESPSCSPGNGVPESAFVAGVVGTGAAVIGVATLIRRRRRGREALLN
jgi:hypothetical protein